VKDITIMCMLRFLWKQEYLMKINFNMEKYISLDVHHMLIIKSLV
jgi:hypothetical protein